MKKKPKAKPTASQEPEKARSPAKTKKLAVDLLIRWREDPVLFVRDNFGVEPDPWQARGLRDFADPTKPRMAFSACAGPGKSSMLAWCGWNFISCYGEVGEHPKGVALSITQDNLRDNLWAELAKWRTRSSFLMSEFDINKIAIYHKSNPKTWFIHARSFQKTANAEEQGRTLSGLHSKYQLYLVDESGDILPSVARAAEQGVGSGHWVKILQAGNPTSQTGMLHFCVVDQLDKWSVIKITGDPDDPERSSRISKTWAQEQIALYGRDHPWVQAYILGQFPSTAINSLLSYEQIDAAMKRAPKIEDFSWSQKRLGIDVARFGDDSSVIFRRQGVMSYEPDVVKGLRSVPLAQRVAWHKGDFSSEVEYIDATGGFGAGAEDALLTMGFSPVPIHFSGKPNNAKYFNMRAEMWFEMAEWIKTRGALPKSRRLMKELMAPVYFFHNGKLRIEEKDQIKARLGFSPDEADGLALTFATPDAPAGSVLGTGGWNQNASGAVAGKCIID